MNLASYAQWVMKLGFPMNDPIVELAVTWARGESASATLIERAVSSCERWREARDKRLRSAATSVLNRLIGFAKAARADEDAKQFRHAPRSLTGGGRRYGLSNDQREQEFVEGPPSSWTPEIAERQAWEERTGRSNPRRRRARSGRARRHSR